MLYNKDARDHTFASHNQAVRETASTQFDDKVKQLQEITGADTDEISINIENQRVYVPGKSGKLKQIIRTVYRVRFLDRKLVGNIIRMSEAEFPIYEFNMKNKGWYPLRKSDHT